MNTHASTERRFPLPAPGHLEPPAEYQCLRAEEPVARVRLPTGHEGWLVASYEGIRAVCTDPRFSKAALTAPDAPRLLPLARGSKSIFSLDPPEHTRLRRIVTRVFTGRQMELLRPRVRDIVEGLLDQLDAAGPPADLLAHFAQPLPIMLICELLGVPYEDTDQFRAWTDVMLSVTAADHDVVASARENLHRYLARLVEAKRKAPAGDVLSLLIAARDEGDALTEEELLTFGHTLLLAGYHATAGQIMFSVLTLLRQPGGLRLLNDHPEMLETAVEELLRYSVIGESAGMMRIATEDVPLGGVTIRAGDPVIPALSSGNRDGAVFDRPDALDLRRADNPHLAFGVGLHHCLGAQLARVELQVALGLLARRHPDLALAVPYEELTWGQGMAFRRPADLPVAW